MLSPHPIIRQVLSLTSISMLLIAVLALMTASSARPEPLSAAPTHAVLSSPTLPAPAVLSDEISVKAAARGNPSINLSDGRVLLTTFSGPQELTQALEQNQLQPLSLASADYDEDGVPDLVSGYAAAGGGLITLHRGNLDSIYPNAPEAQRRRAEGSFTDSPFLSPASVFRVPEGADFLGAGDFDGDSHWDVLAAARDGSNLYLLSGDGRGGLGEPHVIGLPGRVTAMTIGEINRRDGIDDVVVGIAAASGAKALVFEGPRGAMRAEPEAFDLPAEASGLALGELDSSYEVDLAVASGNELIVVYGRDRKLSIDHQGEVERPVIASRAFGFRLRGLVLGRFSGSYIADIAVLSEEGDLHLLSSGTKGGEQGVGRGLKAWKSKLLARGEWSGESKLVSVRTASLAVDGLVVADPASDQMQIVADHLPKGGGGEGVAAAGLGSVMATLDVEGGPRALLPMRLNEDALDDLVILKAGQSAVAVVPTSPQAIFTVTNTNDSGPGSLRQAIVDANENPGADEIRFSIGTGLQTIRPLSALPRVVGPVTIDGTTQEGPGPVNIELNGASAGGSNGLVINTNSCTVRGLVINRFGRAGIHLEGLRNSNIIEGNLIGTNAAGTTALRNGEFGVTSGIRIADNTIGGTTTAARNVISGGVALSKSRSSRIQGNFIGTDINGTIALGGGGISLFDSSGSDTIGGTTAGAGNVISGNGGSGVVIFGSTLTCLVQGNLIGTDKNGTAALGNTGDGVNISSGSTTVGGTTTAARNVISGNGGSGVRLGSNPPEPGNIIQGNYIGTDVTGTADLGNSLHGVNIGHTNNTTGGTAAGSGNIIAFNGSIGVRVSPSTPLHRIRNSIRANSIFSNGALGIDLNGDGVTPNDPGDTDTGPNNLQNFPVLTSAISDAASTTIRGTLNSTANTGFTIEFFSNTSCDISTHGEGQTLIRSVTVTTDGSGDASFTTTLQPPLPLGLSITATATDPFNNTSEFSQCVQVAAGCNYSITPTSRSFAANGGTVSVNVSVGAGCSWTATSNAAFITVTSGGIGKGNGTVTFSVAANAESSIRSGTLTIAGQSFTVYQGIAFLDVATDHPFYTEIGKLSARGLTLGCGGGNYCPDQAVTREQMAAFILRGLGEFNPPTPPGQRFQDVPPSNIFYNFIDRLAALQITQGCSVIPPLYCPSNAVSREQMAAFLIRALHAPGYLPPPPPSQRFQDVPPSNPFYAHIEEMAVRGITFGCSASPPLYCPAQSVTRAQMAAFLVRAFNL